ncbi:hypothetical protein QP185_17720 [Sphingomonas aerolata]|uniref:hypothetical protein n=1 Tax=Sphingomonas aerolata TaxID=185951 RepID=UPI002FDF8F46
MTGPRAAHVLAFERRANGQTLRVAVAPRCAVELLDQSGAAVPAAWWVKRGSPPASAQPTFSWTDQSSSR